MAAFLISHISGSALFNSERGDMVKLIEIEPKDDGRSFKINLVTDAFARIWIENDFVSDRLFNF